MPTIKKNHPPSLKAKIAVEAIQGHKTVLLGTAGMSDGWGGGICYPTLLAPG